MSGPLDALGPAADALLPPGAALLVAVSGGADSVALLHALRRVGRGPLCVATVDHGLDPGSAARARFVEALCATLDIPCARLRPAPAEVAQGQGPEDGARRARYRLLEAHAAAIGAARLLTAHTADDQAETVLMRLASGSGLRGMAGIPARRGVIARPWLGVPRAAVRAWAADEGLRWVEDPTNADARFLRNRARAHAIPGLATAFGPSWSRGAARTAATLAADRAALAHFVDAWLADRLQVGAEGVTIAIDALRTLPQAARRQVLMVGLHRAASAVDRPAPRSMAEAVARLDDLVQGAAGRRATLPGGFLAERRRDGLVLRAGDDASRAEGHAGRRPIFDADQGVGNT
ncbi:MAG: tRNA lysidine(34) synthetase TilS [Myxococcales bacterium]|nr:tRNA lysidine(34) synthetase TilS [Myxococcales bacterium]